MRYLILPDDELQEIVEKETIPEPARSDKETSMALELLEYRRLYGPLGCAWLVKE